MTNYRCPVCCVRHYPKCSARTWSVTPLLELYTPQQIALAIGRTVTAVDRAKERGLTDGQADRWATCLGHHPDSIWPGWLDAGLSVVDVAFLETGWRQAWLASEAAS